MADEEKAQKSAVEKVEKVEETPKYIMDLGAKFDKFSDSFNRFADALTAGLEKKQKPDEEKPVDEEKPCVKAEKKPKEEEVKAEDEQKYPKPDEKKKADKKPETYPYKEKAAKPDEEVPPKKDEEVKADSTVDKEPDKYPKPDLEKMVNLAIENALAKRFEEDPKKRSIVPKEDEAKGAVDLSMEALHKMPWGDVHRICKELGAD